MFCLRINLNDLFPPMQAAAEVCYAVEIVEEGGSVELNASAPVTCRLWFNVHVC